jgi:hypothetical protein
VTQGIQNLIAGQVQSKTDIMALIQFFLENESFWRNAREVSSEEFFRELVQNKEFKAGRMTLGSFEVNAYSSNFDEGIRSVKFISIFQSKNKYYFIRNDDDAGATSEAL